MDTDIRTTFTANRKTFRIAVSILFFMAGLCFASWASRIATIQQKLGLSETELGGILFALPVGSFFSIPFAGWAITKIGSKKLLLSAIITYGLALVGLGSVHNSFQLVLCLIAYGFAGNSVNISVNTQAVAVERLYHKHIMASFHGLWSLAGFSGAGIGTFMIGKGIDPFNHFIAIAVMVYIGVIVASRYLHDDRGSVKNNSTLLSVSERLKLIVPLLALGSIAFFSLTCEGAMFDWSVIYFKKVINAPIALQGAGFTAFMLTMASGRFVADWFAHRSGLKRTLQISGLLTATGLLIAVIFPHFYTAIAGFLLVGVGVSSVVPMVYSAAGKSRTMSPGVALAAVSTIGFAGFLVGPPLIGFIAGIATLRASFLFIAVMGMSVVVAATRAKLED